MARDPRAPEHSRPAIFPDAAFTRPSPTYREATMPAPRLSAEQAHAWLQKHRENFIDELSRWVRIPSIAGPPEHQADLRRSAQWLVATLRDMGFPTVEVGGPDSGPVVWAEWSAAPGAATVLVYSHHDVRTVKAELWDQCPPFDPIV